jgi:hypothetical protein
MLPAAGARAAAPPDAFAFFAHNFAAGARLPLPLPHGPADAAQVVVTSACLRRRRRVARWLRLLTRGGVPLLAHSLVSSLVRAFVPLFAHSLGHLGGARVLCWRAESVRVLLRCCRVRGRGRQLLQRVGRTAARVLGGGGSPDSRLCSLGACNLAGDAPVRVAPLSGNGDDPGCAMGLVRGPCRTSR